MVGAGGYEELVEPEWVKTDYVMRRFSLSETTLRDLLADGTLSASRVGGRIYIRLADVKALMAAHPLKSRKQAV
jgi:excisionase family DNA binding protein